MRAVQNFINILKSGGTLQKVARNSVSTPILSMKPKVITNVVSHAREPVLADNAVKNFTEFLPRYQNAIKDNNETFRIIYDLQRCGEITKEQARKGIIDILNQAYGVSVPPKVIFRELPGHFGEYNEWTHQVQINSLMNLDMITSTYSHEMHHYFEALDKYRALDPQAVFIAKAKSELRGHTFASEIQKENAINKRASELRQYHEQSGWNEILSQHSKYQNGTREFQHGIDMHNADIQTYDRFGNLQELESYTAGTSTFIELQRSVHNNISKAEYDILNNINIVLHENYKTLPNIYQRLTNSINCNPAKFVEQVKYCVRELGIKDSTQITNYLTELL